MPQQQNLWGLFWKSCLWASFWDTNTETRFGECSLFIGVCVRGIWHNFLFICFTFTPPSILAVVNHNWIALTYSLLPVLPELIAWLHNCGDAARLWTTPSPYLEKLVMEMRPWVGCMTVLMNMELPQRAVAVSKPVSAHQFCLHSISITEASARIQLIGLCNIRRQLLTTAVLRTRNRLHKVSHDSYRGSLPRRLSLLSHAGR